MTSHVSIDRITSIARALGPLASDVVFIGGAIAPLLHTQPTLPSARPTKDVDAVVASHKYADVEELNRRMRDLGFVHVMDERGHAHRWRSPHGVLFDLAPAGRHLGGTGNRWDAFALSRPESQTIEGITIRYASPAAFIVMKLEAFNDRGGGDLLASHDMEDIIALIASRPSIAADVAGAAPELSARIRAFASALLNEGVGEEILVSHLNNAEDPEEAVERARSRLVQLAR